MDNETIKIVAVSAAVIVAAVVLFIIFRKVYLAARSAYRDAKKLVNSIQKATDETASTPRTLSGVEDLMKQRILRDFPDFNFNVCKQMIDSAVAGYFSVLNTREGTDKLKKISTPSFINELLGEMQTNKYTFENVTIHKTVISDYRKLNDEAVVTYQSAVGYNRKGKGTMQYVYQSKLVYYLSEDNDAGVQTLVCEYCGAPIDVVGSHKVCKYCGGEISIRNVAAERAWKVNKVAKYR